MQPASGVLNLQTGSIEATDRNKYLTERIPTPFIPEETCPRIDELVRWIANYDPAVEKFFWRWMGYCLTGDMSLHKSLFLKGCGRNKKTTLWAGLFGVPLISVPKVSVGGRCFPA